MKMVECEIIKLESGQPYRIVPLGDYEEKRFRRTCANLHKMLLDGRPVSIISPNRRLDADELEQYRQFFCSYAKEIGRNCIYFEVPVEVTREPKL